MKKIVSWYISLWDEDDNEIKLSDLPDGVAQAIDDIITDLESEEE